MDNKIFDFRLKYEKTIAKISSDFIIGLSEKTTDEVINNSLKEIGNTTNADRVYIFELDHNNKEMNNTYEWCKTGVSSQIHNLKKLPFETFPWWVNKIIRNEIIYIPKVSDMGKEAQSEKEILEMQNISSLIVVPIFYSEKAFGFLGIDNVITTKDWKENDFSLLKLTSHLFSKFYKEKKLKEKIIQKNQALADSFEELKSLKMELIKKEKMSAIQHLASGISHEFNNKIASIKSNMLILKDYFYNMKKTIPKEKINEHLELIINDSLDIFNENQSTFEELDNIIDKVHHLTKENKNNKKHYPFQEIIDDSIWLLNNHQLNNISIEVHNDSEEYIYCDKLELVDGIYNILKNSIESLNLKNKNKKLEIYTYDRGNYIYLDIKDNGTGIKDSNINKIFNPFFTTKSIGQGYGLGLSVSYDTIVHKYNGDIKLKNNKNKTHFQIKFPLKNN
ncbi:MAG: GAF domain-containing sensor histidine kinase [Bacillota bacterium]